MRGKGVRRGKWQNAYRITPAYAGKRTGLICKYPLVRDHPRLCGEKLLRLKLPDGFQGSPPPMRGKVFSQHRKYNSNRITPAYAGKRIWIGKRQKILAGPPPPMRGKGQISMNRLTIRRITPAYAGKSRLAGADFCRVMWITPAYAGRR